MPALFAFTLFLSAFLLFVLQPLCAKMALPTLGGAPAVWNTCMVFFQAGLLAGYAYAHVGPRLAGARAHAVVHVLLLGAAVVFLPVVVQRPAAPPDVPVVWLLRELLLGAGLPFFLLASTAPMLQKWFFHASRGQDPYFLYAASNLGSFAALAAYPFLIEPALTMSEQSVGWLWGYLGLATATLACAVALWRRGGLATPVASASRMDIPVRPGSDRNVQPTLPWRLRLRWLVLAFVPSSLMLSATAHLTTDIAPMPLLWVAPLGLYLLTFVLVFARKPPLPHALFVRWLPVVVVTLAILWLSEATEPLALVLGLHVLGFFWLAMVCHGELAASRPPAQRLTEFYLWLALGGVLGGMFNALAAPLLFSGLAEYPLVLALGCMVKAKGAGDGEHAHRLILRDLTWAAAVGVAALAGVWLARQTWWPLTHKPATVAAALGLPLIAAFLMHDRPLRFGLTLGAIFLASMALTSVHGDIVYQERAFFGVHRVAVKDGVRSLIHGNIVHGKQDPQRPTEPLTYYTRSGPIGQLFTALKGDPRLEHVGLVGLGAGSLAAYVAPGQRWTFFEIDPAVIHIARTHFTFLAKAAEPVVVLPGDGRLLLAACPDKFGVIVIDAFSSDSIPLHLLTREAFGIYDAHLDDHGLLVFHISNRYLDLEPVLAALAEHESPAWSCRVFDDGAPEHDGKLPSIWVALGRRPEDLAKLDTRWQSAKIRPGMKPWTDDFSNITSVLGLAR